MEQYSRRSCVRIFGVEEKSGEDTDQIASKFIRDQLGVPLDPRDIDRSHRTGKMKTLSPESTTEQPSRRHHRAIIVKLSSYKKPRDILNNRKKLKGTGISIVEDLTLQNQNLLKAARDTKKVLSACLQMVRSLHFSQQQEEKL